ncbi:Crp/Fnr family transcriptional regulator [Marinilabiliaceae bacterium JC040]|nr:Crp/Fnr family transcriptional regulator [Marinilabiliaceae bacterium JC040]
MERYIDKLQDSSLFNEIDKDEILRLLNEGGKITKYPSKDFVIFEGDICNKLLILCDGKLKGTMTNSEGKQIIIEEFEGIEILAPAFLFATNNRIPVTIETLSECEIISIPKNKFSLMMNQNETLMSNFLNDLSNKCVLLTEKVRDFALKNLKERLIYYLKNHQDHPNQKELADRFAVARPSLNRVLRELKDENIIEVINGKIQIK